MGFFFTVCLRQSYYVSQTGLELMILLPLSPSVEITMQYHTVPGGFFTTGSLCLAHRMMTEQATTLHMGVVNGDN